MDYQLISTDMDGTLLNSEKLIPQENIEALYKLQDKGIKIMFSTGRTFESAISYAASIDLEPCIAGSNGAIVSYEDTIESFNLDKNKIFEYANKCQEIDLIYQITTQKCSYFYRTFDVFDLFYKSNSMVNNEFVLEKEMFHDISEIKNFEDMNNIIKFDIFDKNNRIKEIYRELDYDIFNIVIPEDYYVELTGKKVNKGNAVKKVAEYFGIPSKNIMSIGDSGNDISMFEYSGCSVSMGNAHGDIKRKSDFVTDTNDNFGFKKALEMLHII
ncbi:Cof-type HAD-IIB family hydrolase [Alkalibaculum sp. M08DMB]|uniref:Cof-type HAD-IIB family hydrolase n=1 Tax=Alkalibaculum sporogenes TaxID=2655001 RepID=A0A6A7K5V9_9FIRM|nr:Cof-type HAD-IIB family hydrolase [Alkalibaculum sporogenes]MPW24744.1 Cof-type HAD-IIB family hydrolase [Alkalibaculum sporogenes]